MNYIVRTFSRYVTHPFTGKEFKQLELNSFNIDQIVALFHNKNIKNPISDKKNNKNLNNNEIINLDSKE